MKLQYKGWEWGEGREKRPSKVGGEGGRGAKWKLIERENWLTGKCKNRFSGIFLSPNHCFFYSPPPSFRFFLLSLLWTFPALLNRVLSIDDSYHENVVNVSSPPLPRPFPILLLPSFCTQFSLLDNRYNILPDIGTRCSGFLNHFREAAFSTVLPIRSSENFRQSPWRSVPRASPIRTLLLIYFQEFITEFMIMKIKSNWFWIIDWYWLALLVVWKVKSERRYRPQAVGKFRKNVKCFWNWKNAQTRALDARKNFTSFTRIFSVYSVYKIYYSMARKIELTNTNEKSKGKKKWPV